MQEQPDNAPVASPRRARRRRQKKAKGQREAGKEIKRSGQRKTDRKREGEEWAERGEGWDKGRAGDRSVSEGLLAEIERLPNQLCVGGPAVRLQGIPQQEHIKERS